MPNRGGGGGGGGSGGGGGGSGGGGGGGGGGLFYRNAKQIKPSGDRDLSAYTLYIGELSRRENKIDADKSDSSISAWPIGV